MPSVRYYNQTAPFWDFVASLEDQGSQYPLFGSQNQSGEEGPRWGWPFGSVPYRSRHGPPPGPPPHEGEHADHPPPPPQDDENGPSEPRGHHHHGRRGGGFGRRGGCHGRGFGASPASQAPFWADLVRGFNTDNTDDKSEDFKPEADIFDTPDTFIVHVSLPGAKKDDIGVNWNAEKSELSIAGVIYRPGDEEFLKNLALNERNIGVFERKLRLGSRANPAQIDADGITAKMEDGVLTIGVPKLDSGYVEIKKVDIE